MRIIALFFSLFLLTAAGISFAEEQRFTVPLENSPQKGPINAPVTIIEFIDFQ